MSLESVQMLGLFVAALTALNVVFNTATALLATLLAIPVQRISTGIGPTILRFSIGRAEATIGLIPIAGSVSFSDEAHRPDIPQDRLFVNVSWPKRALIILTGPLSVICAASLILGVDAFVEAVRFWPQLFDAALKTPLPLNAQAIIASLVEQRGFLAAGAVIAAKAASFNLLPIPILSGGALVLCLLQAMIGRKIPDPVFEYLYRVGFALIVAILLVVLVRIGAWMLG